MATASEIYALYGEGLEVKAIAARLGCSARNVYMHIDKERKRLGEDWPPERVAKALRIHRAALGVIADAFHCEPDELLSVLGQIERRGRAPSPYVPARKPAAARAAPTAKRLYRMQDVDGQFLAANVSSFTVDPDEAWTGTAAEVRLLREKLPSARYCKMREIAQ